MFCRLHSEACGSGEGVEGSHTGERERGESAVSACGRGGGERGRAAVKKGRVSCSHVSIFAFVFIRLVLLQEEREGERVRLAAGWVRVYDYVNLSCLEWGTGALRVTFFMGGGV